MTIAEPMTLLTDYLLAGVTGWLGWLLFRARKGQAARSWWALAFAGLALAAVLGGTHHGFTPQLSESTLFLLWKATLLAVGMTSFAMLAGSTIAATSGRLRGALLALATAKLAVYTGWMLFHDEFIYVIADTGIRWWRSLCCTAGRPCAAETVRRSGCLAVWASPCSRPACRQAVSRSTVTSITTTCTTWSRSPRWRCSTSVAGACTTVEQPLAHGLSQECVRRSALLH